jgi:hypothetical protein
VRRGWAVRIVYRVDELGVLVGLIVPSWFDVAADKLA